MNKLDTFFKHRKFLKEKGVLEQDLPFFIFDEINRKSILIIHGSEASPCNTIDLSNMLYEKGYNVLSILLEGHAENNNILNSGKIKWTNCYNSVKKYFNFLKDFSDDIYILGSSFGGTLAYLLSIELENEISGIITVSAPTHLKKEFNNTNTWANQVYLSIKELEKNINKVSAPCLILHSIDDIVVKYTQAIFSINNIISDYKKLILYDNTGHTLGFSFNNTEIVNDIDNFIKNNVKPVYTLFNLKDNNYNSVNLAGDFNNWLSQDLKMILDKDIWKIYLQLKPGNYQYKFIINNEKWILDPEAKIVYTPNGGSNSIINI